MKSYLPVLLSLVACGSSSPHSGFDTDGGPSPAGMDGGGPALNEGGMVGSNDGAPGTSGPAEVYGESPDTLYKLDPTTKAVTVVGKFQGCTQVIDIALDEASNMFGTTSGSLYAIDRKTARCTHISDGSYPNSLSFVPKGTLDPSVEALVGYVTAFGASDSDYIRIDPKTGAITTVGALGGGLTSSGDIVSVKGGGTYLTVKGGGCNDCIVEVNPTTGALKKNFGSVMHGSVFGLAFWAGSAYGFDDAGELFEITFGATSVTTTSIAIPSKPSGLQFWGAGSTTSAPVVPVR